MKFLILGSNGQLGKSFQDFFIETNVNFVALTRKDLDLTNVPALNKIIVKHSPEYVINCAAWTDVDSAESNSIIALKTNGFAVKTLIDTLSKTNSKLIHFSTDYVFSGIGETPWNTSDPTQPNTIYGKSKKFAEDSILENYLHNSYIFRTAWLYSKYGKNFVKTMIHMGLSEKDEINVVNDQIGQPTHTLEVVKMVMECLEYSMPNGIYHATNQGETSWYGFAGKIFEYCKFDESRIRPVSTSQFKQIAQRPKYSTLSHDCWQNHGINQTPWEIALLNSIDSIFNVVKNEI